MCLKPISLSSGATVAMVAIVVILVPVRCVNMVVDIFNELGFLYSSIKINDKKRREKHTSSEFSS